jgi:hypothetical protein
MVRGIIERKRRYALQYRNSATVAVVAEGGLERGQ